jgi:hypothetical protein
MTRLGPQLRALGTLKLARAIPLFPQNAAE